MIRSKVSRSRVVELEQVLHRSAWQEWIPHWHDEWSIGAILEGTCHCSVGGQQLEMRSGDLISIAPGAVHTGALLPHGERRSPFFVMFYVPAIWIERQGLPQPGGSGRISLPSLVEEARDLRDERSATVWIASAIKALADALPGRPSGNSEMAPSEAERTLIERLQIAILDGERTVTGLALRSGVSRERIHRVISKRLGMSPRDYLRAVRLHRAKSLLIRGERPAMVAMECGFADQAHFTRWFRRTFGYTPGDLIAASGHLGV